FHLAVLHIEPIAQLRMISGNARQPVESEVVRLRCLFAIPGLQQADDVPVEVAPPSRIALVPFDVLLKGSGVTFPKRHRKISWKNVVQGRNIRRTLDACVPAERQNSAAGTSD